MDEKQRTVSEIRAYLEPKKENDILLHDYVVMLEEDLRRMLETAVKLRTARRGDLMKFWYSQCELEYMEATSRVKQDLLMRETAWLEEDTLWKYRSESMRGFGNESR